MRLTYKGHTAGPIEFDDEAGLFSGTVAGLRDVVHFAGRTAEELSQAFRDSVDDDLAWCAERAELPEKPYLSPTGEVRPMIDRKPPNRDVNGGRKPDRAVRLKLGAGCSRVPALAALPGELERRMVALRKPVSGEPRLT